MRLIVQRWERSPETSVNILLFAGSRMSVFQRRRRDAAPMTKAPNLPVKPITGRPRFAAECQPLVLAGKFTHKKPQKLRYALS